MHSRTQILRRIETYLRCRDIEYMYLEPNQKGDDAGFSVRSNYTPDWPDRRGSRYLYIEEFRGKIEILWGPESADSKWSGSNSNHLIRIDPTDETKIITQLREVLAWLGWS